MVLRFCRILHEVGVSFKLVESLLKQLKHAAVLCSVISSRLLR